MAEGAYLCRLRLLLWRDRLVPAAAAGEKREVERCVILTSDDCEESSVYICCWELMVVEYEGMVREMDVRSFGHLRPVFQIWMT
jgi:hypothetical protein